MPWHQESSQQLSGCPKLPQLLTLPGSAALGPGGCFRRVRVQGRQCVPKATNTLALGPELTTGLHVHLHEDFSSKMPLAGTITHPSRERLLTRNQNAGG